MLYYRDWAGEGELVIWMDLTRDNIAVRVHVGKWCRELWFVAAVLRRFNREVFPGQGRGDRETRVIWRAWPLGWCAEVPQLYFSKVPALKLDERWNGTLMLERSELARVISNGG